MEDPAPNKKVNYICLYLRGHMFEYKTKSRYPDEFLIVPLSLSLKTLGYCLKIGHNLYFSHDYFRTNQALPSS